MITLQIWRSRTRIWSLSRVLWFSCNTCAWSQMWKLRLNVNAFFALSVETPPILLSFSPFSRRILSNSEFLYLIIKHSSVAWEWAVWERWRSALWVATDSSSSCMYSVRRSRNAAWACRFRSLRCSAVECIYRAVSVEVVLARFANTYKFSASFTFCLGYIFWPLILFLLFMGTHQVDQILTERAEWHDKLV